ncbi:ImmA/IrrE family metallo-endopeptidase [Sorangium sp. So ce136]|uniref:ImmA/IrrE family metallo-endopeptidase n=1 Tax=Sorangium sp. So ce136 TaxID=3133284 RepID=UPI003F0DADD8
MGSFNPARLILARERRGLNKSRLAERVGVTAQSLINYEAGRTVPTEPTLAKIADALSFPRAFFDGPEIPKPSIDASSFRALSTMTAAQRDAALGAGALAFEVCRWIEQRFSLPPAKLPDLRGMGPEEAAASLRESWGLGLLPIRSVVHLLELYGVRVFSLSEQSREVDAFSLWHGETPFCFLNTTKSAEHGRFDAAHELGHLVLHRHGAPSGRAAEHEADTFASAFLMPRSSVRSEVPSAASLRHLIALKKKWNVSVAALANRSHKVGVLSDWHYRGLCIEMGKRGYRTAEPDPMPNRETSQILHKVFAALREDGLSKADIAKDLCLYTNDVDAIVFGLVLTPIDGGGTAADRPGAPPRTPPSLRLVKS